MTKKKVFKSHKPRKYFTEKRFKTVHGSDHSNFMNHYFRTHMFKEQCSNCGRDFGSHFGPTDTCNS